MIADDPSLIDPILNELRSSLPLLRSLPLNFRKAQLESLIKGLKEMEPIFTSALSQDLSYTPFGSFVFSHHITLAELEHTLNNFSNWAKKRNVPTPVIIGPGCSYLLPEPLGLVLIMSSWNYPVYTALPAVGAAIAAGNAVLLKPSELATHTSHALQQLFQKYLDPRFYRIIEGGPSTACYLTEGPSSLEEKKENEEKAKKRENINLWENFKSPFDLIIFTGSTEKGRKVAEAAGRRLVPCLLELGGKSPVIVDEGAALDMAADKIAFGRMSNCGQTCVAPDYLFVHTSVKQVFLNKLKERIVRFYGLNPEKSVDFSRIITSAHAQRLQGMIDEQQGGTVVFGGRSDPSSKYVCPTIIDAPRLDSKIMKEEIFGPILPVLEFKNISDVISFVNSRPKPLALYYFGPSSSSMHRIINETSSGAFSTNETAFHLLNCDLPFGGVGWSGMGKYHGQIGFDSCSHLKSVFKKSTINCWPFTARYPPYTESKQKIMIFMLRFLNIDQGLLFKRIFKVVVIVAFFILQNKGKMDWFGRGIRGMIDGIRHK